MKIAIEPLPPEMEAGIRARLAAKGLCTYIHLTQR